MFITTLILCLYIIVYVSSLLGHKKKKKKKKGHWCFSLWSMGQNHFFFAFTFGRFHASDRVWPAQSS